jgi:hypothetical protein
LAGCVRRLILAATATLWDPPDWLPDETANKVDAYSLAERK